MHHIARKSLIYITAELTCLVCYLNLRSMEVQFTPEQETQLAQIATQAGIDSAVLVKEAALRLLVEDSRVRIAVREGVAQADRGEFIEEEEMDARFEAMLRS